ESYPLAAVIYGTTASDTTIPLTCSGGRHGDTDGRVGDSATGVRRTGQARAGDAGGAAVGWVGALPSDPDGVRLRVLPSHHRAANGDRRAAGGRAGRADPSVGAGAYRQVSECDTDRGLSGISLRGHEASAPPSRRSPHRDGAGGQTARL